MSHKLLISLGFALIFLILVRTLGGVFRFLVPTLFLYLIGIMVYNYWYLKSKNLYTLWTWLRPLFFYLSLIGIYFVLPNNYSQGLFLIFSVIAIYLVERNILLASEQSLFLETLFSFFGLSLAIFGLSNYLLPANSIILVFFALMTFLVSRSSLDYIPQDPQKKNFYSAILALSVLEVVWALIFSPLHFSINAIIIFNIFYVLWIIIYHYLFHNLSFKKISFHVIFSGMLILISLLSTPWWK